MPQNSCVGCVFVILADQNDFHSGQHGRNLEFKAVERDRALIVVIGQEEEFWPVTHSL